MDPKSRLADSKITKTRRPILCFFLNLPASDPAQPGPQIAPKWTPKGPKMDPKWTPNSQKWNSNLCDYKSVCSLRRMFRRVPRRSETLRRVSEGFRSVPKGSETFRRAPKHSEAFLNVSDVPKGSSTMILNAPKRSEGFLNVPKGSETFRRDRART